jgi:predicted RNA-binding protein associated with RNAse of E/G family
MKTVTLTYKRLPDRVSYFQQKLLYEDEQVIVTSQRVKPSSPIILNGETVLDDNYTAIWFVFTGLWYDIGKIYNLNDEWTGYYCDIMMPVTRNSDQFEIVDLFLDLWVSPDGSYEIQDEDEFEDALKEGIISTELAEKARNALDDLISEVVSGKFPPEFVKNFGSQ